MTPPIARSTLNPQQFSYQDSVYSLFRRDFRIKSESDLCKCQLDPRIDHTLFVCKFFDESLICPLLSSFVSSLNQKRYCSSRLKPIARCLSSVPRCFGEARILSMVSMRLSPQHDIQLYRWLLVAVFACIAAASVYSATAFCAWRVRTARGVRALRVACVHCTA